MAGFSPLMRSIITSGTPNTIQQLSVLLAALDANFPARLTMLNLEFDLAGAGNIYVGNLNVSSTNCGRHLVPAQGYNIAAFDTGMVLTTDIYIKADTASQQINITALPIGQ